MNKFAILLRKQRNKMKLTKKEMATHLGWTPMYYSRFENGNLLPVGKNINKFAKLLELKPAELILIINETKIQSEEENEKI